MTAPQGEALLEALRARLGSQYAIEGLLGQGGMGSVFRARDITLDRPVAIKVIAGDVATNPQLRDRFLQEARTVAKLRHPNIVAVYSAGDAGGVLYFVMELVPGESLRDLLEREKQVEPAKAERILHELALALDYAHANGIVHRDVKPENILLDRETGRAMLTDFGVARALEGDGRMTGTGMILGSPRYMSPEQATGEKTLDGRSDLYALALVGYEMFTGKPVVDAGNVAAMLVKHLTETPKPLADAASAVPEGVATAIDRALQKDRDKRWASGREMAEAIGSGWTPSSGSHGSGMRTGPVKGFALPRTAAGRKRAYIIGGLALASLIVTAVALTRRDGPPRGVDPRRFYAVMPFEVQTANRDVAWLRDGAVNMLTLALSQWRDLTVTDYERTMVLVREAGLEDKRVDLDKAMQIARRSGAWTVVTGTISTTADSLLVDARLYDVVSGRSLQTERRSAAIGDDPRPLFDGLARYLLGVAGGNATASKELAASTTTSLVAYRAYLDGTKALFSWRLPEADSLFRIAVRNDSTFALAWHKRSLALGWGNAGTDDYVLAAARAEQLSERLPPREQALVRGHHALAVGLRAQSTGQAGRPELRRAQEIFRGLTATDSGVPEAWYGLADALYHEGFDGDSIENGRRRLSASLRAFEHTLALDSTFHLAYSHLVQMYQQYSSPGNFFVVNGDSLVTVMDSAQLKRVGGPAGREAMRLRARDRGLMLARAWVRADPDATAPRNTIVTGFFAAGMVDSAMAEIDRALADPAFRTPATELWANGFRLIGDDPRAVEGVAATVRSLTRDELQRVPINDRFQYMALALDAAGASGSAAEVDRTVRLWMSVDTMVPQRNIPARPIFEWYALSLKIAQRGVMTAEEKALFLRRLREMEAEGGGQLRLGALPHAYLGYALTRDTVFVAYVRKFSQPGQTYPELDAALVLARGDTAGARRLAAAFTPADSVRKSRLGIAGMRTALRAELLAELGDVREAAAQYDAIHPSRFNTTIVDPGFAVYVRTFAARARLYEQLGERDKAMSAWEEFLRRWKDGDSNTEPARREARAALQRLKDQSPTRTTR